MENLDNGTFLLSREDADRLASLRIGGKAEVALGGNRVTLALQPADVHTAAELPTYLSGYKPAAFRADEVSQPILVDNDMGLRRDFSALDAFLIVDPRVSTSAAIQEIDPISAVLPYTVRDRCLGSFVPVQTELQQSSMQPRMVAGARAMKGIQLFREQEVMALIGLNTSWAALNRIALVGGEEWGVNPAPAGAASNPIAAIERGIELSAQPVTDIWFNEAVAHAFLKHPEVRDHMRQMLGDAGFSNLKSMDDFIIPGLPTFHISRSKFQATAAGARGYCLPSTCCVLICKTAGEPRGGEEIASTYTFRRKGPSGTGITVREYFVDGRGSLGGTMIAVTQADDVQMVGTIAGAHIAGV